VLLAVIGFTVLMYELEVDDVATKGEPLMTMEVERDVEAEGTLYLLSLTIN
jgi:hypothetical protein